MTTHKKPLAFFLAISGNLAFAAANVALGINKYVKNRAFDIVIYHSGLEECDEHAFLKIPNVKLQPFAFSEDLVKTLLEEIPEISRFRSKDHLMTLCHFEIFFLLSTYNNVVWLDADIAIQSDIGDIINYAPFGITLDTPWSVQDQFTSPIEGYCMEIPSYCAAIIIVNDRLPYEKIYNWCYEKTIEFSRFLINADQSIINLAIQEFNIDVNIMPLEIWQCISWKKEANIANIVHFGSKEKVWNDNNICCAFPEWYRTHLEWLALGGNDFDNKNINPKNILPELRELEKLRNKKNKLKQKIINFFKF